jgi:hypothetical protein
MNKIVHTLLRNFRHIIITFLLVLYCTSGLGAIAQTQTEPLNPIGLEITRVQIGATTKDTRFDTPGNWSIEEPLSLDDTIRYRWKNVVLDETYRDNPKPGGGYLKVYKDDETKPENFLIDNGGSPLELSKLRGKLTDGKVKLVLLFVDSTKQPLPNSKATITFNFVNKSSKPTLSLISPEPGSLLAEGVKKDFVVELENISLNATDLATEQRGKVSVYYNEVKNETFLATFSQSTRIDEKKQQLKFDFDGIDWKKANIPDNLNTKLIFLLTKVNGESLNISQQVEVKTNFQNSLDVGLPKITILEPKKDRSDSSVTGNIRFIIGVDNFTLKKERSNVAKDGKSGYMQILIDDAPYKILWGETTFNLNEIGYSSKEEGRRTIKVQLVNTDFTKLDKETSDTIEVIYKPIEMVAADTKETEDVGIKNSNWRTIIIILTIILIVSGIAVLITKG